MPKFNILYKTDYTKYMPKLEADYKALALAIGYYFPEATIQIDYIHRPNTKQIILGRNLQKYKLLWHKYILQKPMLLPKTNTFELIYMGVQEHNDMLTLCNTDLFTSCSYGLGYDSNALIRHSSRHPLSLERLNIAYAETKGALITSAKPLSNQLIEALAFETNIVFSKSAQNKPWLTARLPEDIKHIIARQDEQQLLRQELINKVFKARITKNELQKLCT